MLEGVKDLQERLTELFRVELGATTDLRPVGQTGRVSGVVVSVKFEDLDVGEQQKLVRDLVRDHLGSDAVNVSTLVTLTHKNHKAVLGEAEGSEG